MDAMETYAARATSGQTLKQALIVITHLVAHQQLVDVLRRVSVNLVQPLLHAEEGLHVCHVVHDDDAMRVAVVGGRDGVEPLLACSVPDLQLDCLPVEVDGADLEVHANGGDVRLGVGVVGESHEQTGLLRGSDGQWEGKGSKHDRR
jgi:hypothetical protein